MSLWRTVGKAFVEEQLGAGQPPEEQDEETKKKAAGSKKKKLALIVVGVSALGLLALSGALTAILKWVLGAAFIAGLVGGGYYLARNKVRAMKGAREAKKIEAQQAQEVEESAVREERAAVVKQRTLEDQLAELKRKKAAADPERQ